MPYPPTPGPFSFPDTQRDANPGMEKPRWSTRVEGRGDTGRLTLLLQFWLPRLKETSDKLGAGVIEEPLNCLSGSLVLVEYFAGLFDPMWGIWGWHPRSSLETQDISSLKCCVEETFCGAPRVHLTSSKHLELKGI